MELKTKKDRLTAYGFACGYIERREYEDENQHLITEIWHEHNVYHVRQNDRHQHNHMRIFWKGFDTLAEARNCFNRQRGELVS